jgi:hypothetical protein
MKIPQEDFERLMCKVVNGSNAAVLFAVPGVWDAISTDVDYVKWVQEEWQAEQQRKLATS